MRQIHLDVTDLPPGPAFIQYLGPDHIRVAEAVLRERYQVPPGYVWRFATDHSPAGWVRPMGKAE